jgi:hypothetical protein
MSQAIKITADVTQAIKIAADVTGDKNSRIMP